MEIVGHPVASSVPGSVDHVPGHGPLRILHVGASASPHSVNGVNTAIWRIARAQAGLGNHVHLPMLTKALDESLDTLHLTHHVVPASRIRFDRTSVRGLLKTVRPDIVHIHSAFIPRHSLLGRHLRRTGIPYVVTPHGALLPHVLRRDRLKKLVYSLLFEKPYVRGASGVTAVTPQELEHVREFARPASLAGRFILNPICPDFDDAATWKRTDGRPFILFLGRFDVRTKGLDRLIEIARLMPDADFHLYGRPHSKLDDLFLKKAPTNVTIHEPVFGTEKAAVWKSATLYLQASRWEAFSLSVAEALGAGVPCALTETLDQAQILTREGAACTIPEDPARAARVLEELLTRPEALRDLSIHGRRFARERLTAESVAKAYVDFYREILKGRRACDVAQHTATDRPLSSTREPAYSAARPNYLAGKIK